jgi:hypothetical protein
MAKKPQSSIRRDSIFGRTTSAGGPQPAQGIAAPESATRQTAVWLADEELEWLDSQVTAMKRGGWRNLTRSQLLRALTRAMMEQAPDLGGITGEQELIDSLRGPRA